MAVPGFTSRIICCVSACLEPENTPWVRSHVQCKALRCRASNLFSCSASHSPYILQRLHGRSACGMRVVAGRTGKNSQHLAADPDHVLAMLPASHHMRHKHLEVKVVEARCPISLSPSIAASMLDHASQPLACAAHTTEVGGTRELLRACVFMVNRCHNPVVPVRAISSTTRIWLASCPNI